MLQSLYTFNIILLIINTRIKDQSQQINLESTYQIDKLAPVQASSNIGNYSELSTNFFSYFK